jgi:WD40 repeat protein/energy-coupling factor transporter ATP-binding protein EcfA2
MKMDTRSRTNPFPGLRPFMQEEADLFFGRDRQSDELVRRLASRRFLAVVGTSGSGKSSLVRAGLLPSLEGGLMAGAGAHWRIAIMRPQDDPIGSLARAIVDSGVLAHLDLAQAATEGIVETTLRRSSLGLVEVARLARLAPHENLLILVDQFEELFRFADLARQRDAGDEAPAFVKLLLEAARQTEVAVYVVITMRSDFLGDCARFRDLPEAISDSEYLIPRLTRDELQAVISGPIGVRGGRIAPSLVQRLLNDVGDDMDQLPVLQHALMRAWDHWERDSPDGRPIELGDLDAIGGMAEALSRHADEAFGSLATDRERKLAERLFKCLTERGPDNREIRRPSQISHIGAIANADPTEVIQVVEVFRAPGRSFLMPPHGVALEADSVIDISHESLIRQWRRLRTWVEEESESRASYLRVVEAARLRRAGKAGLWGEPDLTYARQWQERETPNAMWAERYAPGFEDASAFLRDSEAAHAAELEQARQRAEAERVAKERELEQARALAEAQRQRADEQAAARVRQGRLTWGLLAFLGLALGAAGFGWYQMDLAQKGQQRAEEQTRLAEKNAREAAEQRVAAEKSSAEAVTQKRLAEESAAIAVDERKVADQQRHRAETQQRAAESQRQLALSRQLTGLANSEMGQGGLQRAFLFAAAGYAAAPANEARQILQRAFAAQPQLRTFLSRHQAAVSSVAFSPDGKMLASASADWSVILWDVASRKPSGEPLEGHRSSVESVAFSPDGRMLASASSDGAVILWDVARRKRLEQLKGHQSSAVIVAFSPDGRTLASGSWDRTVILWDVASGNPLGELKGHGDAVFGVAFSPDGKMLASGSADRTVILWDVARREPLGTLEGHRDAVSSIAFSSDGRTLASAGAGAHSDGRPIGDNTVILWDVASRKSLGELKGHRDRVSSVAFSRDGETLASASEDKTVILWDVAKRMPLGEPLKGHQGAVNIVAFSPDGKTLASAGEDNTVILWDMARRNPLGEPLESPHGIVRSVAFSPDGRTLASGSGKVVLWDVASRKPLTEQLDGASSVVAFSPDGKILATSASKNETAVILWDLARRKPLGDPLKGHAERVVRLAFSPDGRTLASASRDATVVLWDLASGKRLGEPLKGHQHSVSSVAFSPDGKTLASASPDWSVMLWGVATRKSLGEPLKDHKKEVWGVAFSPDGKTLASASSDDTVILWDVASRKRLGEPLDGQQDHLWSVAFSPDGRTLAAADKTVVLWDAASRKLLGDPLEAHRDKVWDVAFSPDGKTLASASDDQTVILWDLDVASWIRKACAIANRNLTRWEWAQYVGQDVPYRAPCPELPVSKD